MTRDRVIKAVRGAQRLAGIDQGVHILRHHVLFAPGDEGSACEGHPGARRPRGSLDDPALHAPESGATEDAIRLLDGRQSGLEPLEKFGDILDTGSEGGARRAENPS